MVLEPEYIGDMATASDLLVPPRVKRGWYVLAWSDEVSARPIARELWGLPIVLFRDAGGAVGALLDRCPHRNVPLTDGRVRDGQLECPYHGWRFATDGRCMHVPGLADDTERASRRCPGYPVREQQGCVWVWGDPDSEPTGEPFRFRWADEPGYLVVRRDVRAPASVHMVAENALDVPHTAFLHGGLFRTDGARKPIECVVQRHADHVACEYIGEARPEGLVGRLLSPSGGTVTHFDRFYLPSVVEVEYRIGDENHIVVNAALTPVNDYDTRLYAVVAVRTRLPGWLLRPLVQPIALWIFRQDVQLLRRQTERLHRFGEQRYISTDIDLLGPHILALLRQAEAGREAARSSTPKSVRMLV